MVTYDCIAWSRESAVVYMGTDFRYDEKEHMANSILNWRFGRSWGAVAGCSYRVLTPLKGAVMGLRTPSRVQLSTPNRVSGAFMGHDSAAQGRFCRVCPLAPGELTDHFAMG